MVIGVARLDILIPGAHSLKDRRRVLKSLKDQLRSRFNCSVAEIGDKEKWARAQIAIAVVGDQSRFVNSQLDTMISFVANKPGAELLSVNLELL